METATSIELFVEILDRYVYYFDQQNESVSRIAEQNDNVSSVPHCLHQESNQYFR